jgi:hypothetical protein
MEKHSEHVYQRSRVALGTPDHDSGNARLRHAVRQPSVLGELRET